jgi:hypothetical protein
MKDKGFLLDNDSYNIMCRATDHIQQQIDMVRELEMK